MRIVAGSLRSRTLKAPKGDRTRPTSDRVRESLFAVLGSIDGANVLDLYAGSGALALEAISRGARSATCVESARPALAVIAENARSLGVEGALRVVARRVGESVKELARDAPFDLVFVDSPWADVPGGALEKELAPFLARAGELLTEDARFVVEHDARDEVPPLPPLVVQEHRRWGDTAVTIFTRGAATSGAP